MTSRESEMFLNINHEQSDLTRKKSILIITLQHRYIHPCPSTSQSCCSLQCDSGRGGLICNKA